VKGLFELADPTAAVTGLGYVGLPTAATIAKSGMNVIGIDISQDVLDRVMSGSDMRLEEPGLAALIDDVLTEGTFRVSAEPQAADYQIVAVPTPIDDQKKADIEMLINAVAGIASVVRPGDTVMVESTVPPGTMLGPVSSTLEEVSNLTVGEDLNLAYCPERVLPGSIIRELVQNDRVVGAVNAQSYTKVHQLYSRFVEGEIFETDIRVAELVKLAENAYRDVGIALSNSLADVSSAVDVDVWEVIKLANRHPRVNYLEPGGGVGGHCIPVDPWFLIESAERESELFQLARKINDGRPGIVVSKIESILGGVSGRRIAILGLAYKPNVGDIRESPALEVVSLLSSMGADVTSFDPFVNGSGALGESVSTATRDAELIVLCTQHDALLSVEAARSAVSAISRIVLTTGASQSMSGWAEQGFEVIGLYET
jgi:UDP-N-acetyl-D-mannosaminuronic acid dehydrogenase